jgi:hypothetical protein
MLSEYEIIEVQDFEPDDTIWVKLRVQILNTKTQEVVECSEKGIFNKHEGKVSLYIWKEGNYSCDCNRELMFERAKGTPEDELNTTCGKGKYLVNIFTTKGKQIHTEF